MLPCPRCDAAIDDDAIACPICKTVVRFFCDNCNTPILINLKQCPACGAENVNYDAMFDKNQVVGESKPVDKAMESAFDDENSSIAREIAELKNELGKSEMADAFSAARSKSAKPGKPSKQASGTDGDDKALDFIATPATDEAHLAIQSMATSSADLQPDEEKPVQKVVSAWDGSVVVHSRNSKEPVHIGLGTDPWKAHGIPGTIIITQSAFIFISYIPQIRNINDVFAYVSFNIDALNDYHLDPEMPRNYLVFNSQGVFKKKFPGTLAINVNFTWSKDAANGDVQNQMFQFRSLIEKLKLFKKVESKLLSGDYLFTQGKKPANSPDIRDILQELKNIPTVNEIIVDRYPSLGKI
ncbi:MAG: zinc ribbon domain-containing protein [Candidatus Sigynarchaeota archaeon]